VLPINNPTISHAHSAIDRFIPASPHKRDAAWSQKVSGNSEKSSLLQSCVRLCASRAGLFDGLRSTIDGCYEQFNLDKIARSTADSHPANAPAMAVIETLCHPFATAKIVVWTWTRSVGSGPIAVRRDARGDATLCACGHSSERTSNRCARDEDCK